MSELNDILEVWLLSAMFIRTVNAKTPSPVEGTITPVPGVPFQPQENVNVESYVSLTTGAEYRKPNTAEFFATVTLLLAEMKEPKAALL
jgi:hypothetical protein